MSSWALSIGLRGKRFDLHGISMVVLVILECNLNRSVAMTSVVLFFPVVPSPSFFLRLSLVFKSFCISISVSHCSHLWMVGWNNWKQAVLTASEECYYTTLHKTNSLLFLVVTVLLSQFSIYCTCIKPLFNPNCEYCVKLYQLSICFSCCCDNLDIKL